MLTHRQAEAHRFIFEFIRDKGRGPTLREIAQGIGPVSVTTARDLVEILIRKRVLERDEKYHLQIVPVWLEAVYINPDLTVFIPLEAA